MKKRLLVWLLVVPGLAAFTGCSTDSDHGAYAPQNTTVNNLEDSASFVLLDEDVQHSVTCSGLQTQRLADGRLQVGANTLTSDDAWGFTFLDENAQQGVTFGSMNDKAIRYTIRVRQAR